MKNLFAFLLIATLLLISGCGQDQDKNTIEATGTIEAVEVVLSARSGGEVRTVFIHEGKLVNAGDTLAMIDTESLSIQLDQAEANCELAQAQLDLLQRGARKEDIRQAENSLTQADASLDQAERDKERTSALLSANAVTKKQFDDVLTRYDMALAARNTAAENLEKIRHIARPEEIRQAQARVKQANAAAELLKKGLRDAVITAPRSGFVVNKFVEEGETVSPGASLFKIADLSRMELAVYVSETEMGRIKLGTDCEIKVDFHPDKSFRGTVVFISPEAEFTPKNIQTKDERTKLVFKVKIAIPNPDYQLKAGMPADAIMARF